MSTPQIPNNPPNCNATVNDYEFYDPNSAETLGKVASIPFLIISVIVTIIVICCSGCITKSMYSTSGWTFWSVVLSILCVLCSISCAKSSIDLYSNVSYAKEVQTKPGSRPCISSKTKTVLA
jgi:hypothetical protein